MTPYDRAAADVFAALKSLQRLVSDDAGDDDTPARMLQRPNRSGAPHTLSRAGYEHRSLAAPIERRTAGRVVSVR